MLSGKRIILGVTGGIAAYKAVYLLRALQKMGAEVRVTLTPAATHFVGKKTFSSLSKNDVPVHIFPDKYEGGNPGSWTRHINWGEWADIFIIAPCTANSMAKIAHGISDNMLTATVLAARCPLLICPTMDGEMYRAPATRRNMNILDKFGYHVLEPETGYLASGLNGMGRLPEVEKIVERTIRITHENIQEEGPLSGKKVVVTGGPTREYIDAVRFLSNPSSGKMGLSMAKAAYQLGADVTFIHGPISLDIPTYLNSISIKSTGELFEAVKKHQQADCIIMAAAVSDFRPAKKVAHKYKKDAMSTTLNLEANPDILAWLGKNRSDDQVLIGFAMETDDLIENAQSKLERKNVDWIAANSISEHNPAFGDDQNEVTLIDREKQIQLKGSKDAIARKILSAVFDV